MEPITIAMCVYNAEKYLQKTLDSLEKQDYPEIRWLFVDDGSTDQSAQIIQSFYQKHLTTTQIYRMTENVGTARARNMALQQATTRLMMFFDSDDIAKENMVSALYAKLSAEPDCIAVGCCAKYIDEKGRALPGGMFFQMGNAQDFRSKAAAGKLIFLNIATLLDRECALRAGGYRVEGFPRGTVRYEDLSEDLDLWSRMSDLYTEGKVMLILPEVLYYYRKTMGSLSAPKEKQFAMMQKIKYIKVNLKRRRAGQPEITFCDFLDSQTQKEKDTDQKLFKGEYYYRKAAFAFAEKRYYSVPIPLLLALINNPKHVLQKLRLNANASQNL